jgi:hypothetical protein
LINHQISGHCSFFPEGMLSQDTLSLHKFLKEFDLGRFQNQHDGSPKKNAQHQAGQAGQFFRIRFTGQTAPEAGEAKGVLIGLPSTPWSTSNSAVLIAKKNR